MLLTLILCFFVIILVIILIIYILSVIGLWKMFQKAGKSGWPSLIPIYNTYILCEITGVSPWWLVICFGAGVITVFIPFLSILGSVVSIYFGVLLAVSTARSFGKSDGYALGLYFFGFIFYFILGVDNSRYLGPKPMKDIIFKKPASTVSNNVVTDVDTNVIFCSSCGAKLDNGVRFCTNCGKEL